MSRICLLLVASIAVLPVVAVRAQESGTAVHKVLFISGPPSHDYGAHEHYAGCVLLAKALEAGMGNFETDVTRHEWPTEKDAFENVDAVVIYSDGGPGHPAIEHLEQLNALAAGGMGVVCIHYAVEIPKGESGNQLMRLIGGYFETDWSVNPHWRAKFTELPEHPVTRGVEPFECEDEWYFHMRFLPEGEGLVPILSAVAPESTMDRPDGSHSGNPYVRLSVENGEPQTVAWAVERNEGGRGFGFTGGHFHWNWANRNFRRLVLNSIVWTAGGEVPEQGVPVDRVDLATLEENQDFEKPADFDTQQIRREQPDLKDALGSASGKDDDGQPDR